MKLFNKNFSLVVLGQIVSLFAASILRFALSTYILDITGRPDLFALVFAVSAVPGVLLSPLGGAIADRFNRRNLMVIFDFASSTVALSAALLFARGFLSIPVIGIIMTLLAMISFIYQPAVQASIPVLQTEGNLEKANGIVMGVGALSGLSGPIVGGLLYGLVGLKVLIEISCLAFFLSAVMEIFIEIPFEKKSISQSMAVLIFKDIKDGFYYVTKRKPEIFKIMTLAALLNLFLVPFFIIGLPYIYRITLGLTDRLYGLSLGVIELSTIVGALTVRLVTKRMQLNTLYKWIFVISAFFAPLALAFVPQVLKRGFLAPFFILNLFAIPIAVMVTQLSIFVVTAIQKETPNDLLGKVMATITAVSQSAAPLGQLLYGGLFAALKGAIYVPLLIIGVIVFLIGLVGKTFKLN